MIKVLKSTISTDIFANVDMQLLCFYQVTRQKLADEFPWWMIKNIKNVHLKIPIKITSTSTFAKNKKIFFVSFWIRLCVPMKVSL